MRREWRKTGAASDSPALGWMPELQEKAAPAKESFERAATPGALAPQAACRSVAPWAREPDAAERESASQPTAMTDLAAARTGPGPEPGQETAQHAEVAEPQNDQRMLSVAEREHSRKEPEWCGPGNAAAAGTTGQRRADPQQAWPAASIPPCEKHAHQMQSFRPDQAQLAQQEWMRRVPQAAPQPSPANARELSSAWP